jgi:hypothetical protein
VCGLISSLIDYMLREHSRDNRVGSFAACWGQRCVAAVAGGRAVDISGGERPCRAT